MTGSAEASKFTLGVVQESLEGERRVAIVPESIGKLVKFGFAVRIEKAAGQSAGFSDDDYESAGATIADRETAWTCDVVVKVCPPTQAEVAQLPEGSLLIALLDPLGNKELVASLAEARVNALALDRIPRISRAQKMDVLSSMANIAGYRAVLEAAVAYEGFFGATVTAAGTLPPAKVLVIGAGVAGLQAIAAARALGAEVRAFDVRPATAEQVESLGAKFLMLDFDESGEGEGGYAKTMSKEFIDAEMALFADQAKEVDVIVTTALIPGKKAPVLITKAMVESMKPGSVVVDLAASHGGNCEVTEAGEHHMHESVHILGHTDLTSRMASTSSRFFSGNIVHLLSDMVGDEGFSIDLEDEVVRGALQSHDGEVLPPPPRPAAPPKVETPPQEVEAREPPPKPEPSSAPTVIAGALALGVFALVGLYAPDSFVPHFTVFVLACFVGWQVVWSVTAALHTPLMSVTNAISGIILVGGMLQAGNADTSSLATILGAVALLFASINVAGGFLVTQRMLKMFQKGGS
ncbi:MAG: Re/Si-specific NAD(P)(+) transhydrogenase subunit alpha [Myxococcota bacterium]